MLAVYFRMDSNTWGLWTLNALLMRPNTSQVLGLLHQHVFTRPKQPLSKTMTQSERESRPWNQRESYLWRLAIEVCRERLDEAGWMGTLTFIIDAEADIDWLFEWAAEQERVELVVRLAKSNRVDKKHDAPLSERLETYPFSMAYELKLPRQGNRRARIEVRHGRLWLQAGSNPETGENRKVKELRNKGPTQLWMVDALEREPPHGDEVSAARWTLICTGEIKNLEDAIHLGTGTYGRRWAVERLHHCWKQVLRAPETRLRTREALESWVHMTIGAAVEIEEMMTLSREQPELNAVEVLGRAMVEAILSASPLKAAKKAELDEVSLERAVAWLANIGGYIDRPSQGPPGHATIGRGLERIDALIRHLELQSLDRAK